MVKLDVVGQRSIFEIFITFLNIWEKLIKKINTNYTNICLSKIFSFIIFFTISELINAEK